MYLVAILDWFSRFVVAWELDQTLELPFVLTAVDHALSQATPAIWNSDQGKAATSPAHNISSAFPLPASRSAWMAAVGRRKYLYRTLVAFGEIRGGVPQRLMMLLPARREQVWLVTSTSTTSNAPTRLSTTRRLPRFMLLKIRRCYTQP